ncbi:hypothetical protein BA059_16850 [Mycolicibacterium sp. (ex Dasyatis americana)]|nr:hypothetical protein BA059_16850 [Mycolicibacterium sp. (ex Dasyatis americana)]
MAPTATVSTPRLSEVARHLVYPSTIRSSVYPRVQKRLRSVGVEFDLWQQGFSSISLGVDESGKFASTIGGVVASIPRQVGKTFTVGHLLIGLCLEFPGLRVIWTSHHLQTTGNTFQSMQGMVRKPKIFALVEEIRLVNGEQRIRFTNGSVIMFGARALGFGRGMDKIDVEVFDEAQILPMRALEDMVPATNQAQNPHGALLFFIGTPPRPVDDGEAFTAKRRQALDGNAEDDMVYVEFSAEPGSGPDDQSQWPIMNPSFPTRTPLVSMLRMRKNLPDEDAWRREAMGIWDSMDASVFSIERWRELEDRAATQPDRVVLTVAVAQDRSWACIGAAGDVSGKTLVMCHSMKGLSGVAAKVLELREKWDVAEVALVGAQAKALQPDLVQADVEFEVLTGADEAASCAAFQEAVKDGTVVHVGQHELDVAVKNARTRISGESERWDRKDVKIDDSPLVAVSGAFYRWGVQKDAPMPAIY